MHQALQGASFHIEHITPQSAGGADGLDNLALACPGCNLKKSNRMTVTDPESGTELPLFNPRVDRWAEHFEWDGARVVGRTPTGRAMIAAFDLNHTRRVMIRGAEALFDLFPPSSSAE
jgi:hypothetical protein